jgi:predicted metal-dependent phosphoesterase TrpH
VLKVELHAHSGDDPLDRLAYSTYDLIDRAASLGYDALAITLHDRQLDLGPFLPFAEDRGITLIPGIERTIEGKHVLLLNFSADAEKVSGFDDLAHLKAREGRGLVVAPHAFYPVANCLGGRLMERHARLFDAVEYNAMFTRLVNFNEAAARWAHLHGKPMVGNGDIHRLRQLGTTWSLVDAAPDADAICAAVRAGRVEVHATPLSLVRAASIMADLYSSDLRQRLQPGWSPLPSRVPETNRALTASRKREIAL